MPVSERARIMAALLDNCKLYRYAPTVPYKLEVHATDMQTGSFYYLDGSGRRAQAAFVFRIGGKGPPLVRTIRFDVGSTCIETTLAGIPVYLRRDGWFNPACSRPYECGCAGVIRTPEALAAALDIIRPPADPRPYTEARALQARREAAAPNGTSQRAERAALRGVTDMRERYHIADRFRRLRGQGYMTPGHERVIDPTRRKRMPERGAPRLYTSGYTGDPGSMQYFAGDPARSRRAIEHKRTLRAAFPEQHTPAWHSARWAGL